MADEQTPEDEIAAGAQAEEAEMAAEEPTDAGASDGDLGSEPEAEETAPEAEPPAAAEPVAAEPAAPDSPKDRRRKARAAKAAAAPTRPALSGEERQAERDEERRRKATIRRNLRTRTREKERTARAPAREPQAPRLERHPGQQKTRQGVVVSDRAAKTIIVRIDVTRRHPRYAKIVRTSRTLHAHDEKGEAHVGDTVIVRESRPLSRTKRWRLVEVVERAR